MDQRAAGTVCWVACDRCSAWRRVTDEYAATIDDDIAWYCENNPDPSFAACSIPQELTDAEIDLEAAEAAAAAAAEASEPTPPPEAGLDEQTNLPKLPAVVQLISENVYSHRGRKQQDEDDIMVCHCPPPWRGGDGCGPNCINRMLCIECTEDFCPCENHCTNQMFTKKQYGKVSVRRAGPKGFGLFADEDLAAGQFVIQYVGEVLEEEEYLRRKQYYITTGQRHYYFMNIGNGEVIDACRKGNVARFINHSCEPNCETQKWMVQGELAIGLFTLRKIKAGEELTFDYNFERYGDKPMRCFCASKRCRKFIGGTQETTANIVELGDAEDVTHDPEPVLVGVDETDVLVQAMLDKEVGTTQRGWDKKLLNRLQQLCRQKGIDWSYTPDEAGLTASTQAAVGAGSPGHVDQSEESSHAAGTGPAAAAAASPASSSAPTSGGAARPGVDGAVESLLAGAAAAAAGGKARRPAKRKRPKAEDLDPEAAAAAAAKKQQAEERKRQRLLQQQEKRQRQQEAFLRRQQEELLRIQRLREQQQQGQGQEQEQEQEQEQQAVQKKKRQYQQLQDDADDDDREGASQEQQEQPAVDGEHTGQQQLQAAGEVQQPSEQQQQHGREAAGEQQQQLDVLGDAEPGAPGSGNEEKSVHESELEDDMSSDDMQEPSPQQQQQQQLQSPSQRLSSRVKVVQRPRSRPPLAPKQQHKEEAAAAPTRRSFLTLAVSAPAKAVKRRSEVDRRLEQLVQKQSWKLKEPSKQSVIKVLRMFNLCDITPRQVDPAQPQPQQQQQDGDAARQQAGPEGGPGPGPAAAAGTGGGSAAAVGSGLGGATVVGEEGLPQLPQHLQPLQALRGAELEARERESEARFRARQRARMADMGMLLDVVLASSSEKLKKEWVDCGILTQLQQALGRLPFTQEYSVVLVKVVAALEHLPVSSDDLYTMRSAHGTFADLIRRMASSAADWEVRRRSHQLLKRYAAANCSDATLLQLYNLPGPGGKPYLLSLHLPPAQLSRLMGLLPKNGPTTARKRPARRGRTPPFRGGPGPGGPGGVGAGGGPGGGPLPGPAGQGMMAAGVGGGAGGPGGPPWFPGHPPPGSIPGPMPPAGPPLLDQHSSPSTSHGAAHGSLAAGSAGDTPGCGPVDGSGAAWPPPMQQQQQLPAWDPASGLPPPPWAAGGGAGLPPHAAGGYRPGVVAAAAGGAGRPPGRHVPWSPGGAGYGSMQPQPGSGSTAAAAVTAAAGAGGADRHPEAYAGAGPSPATDSRGFPLEGPWGQPPAGDRYRQQPDDLDAGGQPPGSSRGPYGGRSSLDGAAGGGGGAPLPCGARERERERSRREHEQGQRGERGWEWEWQQQQQQQSFGDPADGRQAGVAYGHHPADAAAAASKRQHVAGGWQAPPGADQGGGGGGGGGAVPQGGAAQGWGLEATPGGAVVHGSSKPRITDILDDAGGGRAGQARASENHGNRGWQQHRAVAAAAAATGGATVEDLFVLGVYDSRAQPPQEQEAGAGGSDTQFAWQALDDAAGAGGEGGGRGQAVAPPLSPLVSGRFTPPMHGGVSGRPVSPLLPLDGEPHLAMEEVLSVRRDPVLSSRTPGVAMSACLAGDSTQQQHWAQQGVQQQPHQQARRPQQQQQQQQWPDSWDQPGPEFEAFVSDAVKHRLGKYVQPDHPNCITKEEAQQLYKKLRRQVVDKEEAACAERRAVGSFKPIERVKLEANIKEFVRLSIRRLHGAKTPTAGGPGPGSTLLGFGPSVQQLGCHHHTVNGGDHHQHHHQQQQQQHHNHHHAGSYMAL